MWPSWDSICNPWVGCQTRYRKRSWAWPDIYALRKLSGWLIFDSFKLLSALKIDCMKHSKLNLCVHIEGAITILTRIRPVKPSQSHDLAKDSNVRLQKHRWPQSYKGRHNRLRGRKADLAFAIHMHVMFVCFLLLLLLLLFCFFSCKVKYNLTLSPRVPKLDRSVFDFDMSHCWKGSQYKI